MAGHSKWANIKRRKGAQDAKKGVVFAKYARDIMRAAKQGGPDPAGNFRLRTAIEKGKAAGLPNDNIARAIEKGAGTGDGADQSVELTYEGYGPGGVALFIEAETDNKNRTAGDIRSYFNKYNGNLGADGCVAWLFEEKGLIKVKRDGSPGEEEMFEVAVECGAEDFKVNDEDEVYEIYTTPTELNQVCAQLTEHAQHVDVDSAEITRIPQNTVNVTDADHAKSLMKLLDAIEEHDDVQTVYANFEMDDALLESVTS